MKKIILWILIISLLFVIPLKLVPKQQVVEKCIVEIPIITFKTKVPLEEYVLGVINGEMPASFHLEALKAQAIAARTYAIYQTNYGKKPMQTTTAHQVYQPKIDPAYMDKLQQAVLETENQIMTYDSKPISAMFHAASNGQTESAQNYSGKAINYLQSVPSPEQYSDTKRFTLKHINELLQENFQLTHLKKAQITRNSTNRVETITIHNRSYTGRVFREKLALKSTDFTIETTAPNHIMITTKGYGHGVGMSQYGANERAQQGANAAQILNHYYPSARIEALTCTKPV